jgi:hypothetical protein
MKKRNLPPDPEKMNNDRAEWAAAALRHFQCTTGTDRPRRGPIEETDHRHRLLLCAYCARRSRYAGQSQYQLAAPHSMTLVGTGEDR